ncbi:MAG: SOS response-associated peptidase [Alphaproteobacteria bacterium]|nr:SOS response-associated peptidase [Alphaproteobacteria bacterium]
MCVRYVNFISAQDLSGIFRTAKPVPNIGPSWNLGPEQDAPVVWLHRQTGQRRLDVLRWGLLPHFTKNPKGARRPVNARAEVVATAGMFRDAFAARRCLVPAGAFYEWKQVSGLSRQPFAVARADGATMAFAGIWERWRAPNGLVERSFAIVTTGANADMADLHERMPVIVAPEDWPKWLGEVATDPALLLHPPPSGTLRSWPVSRKVNRRENDGAALLEPLGDPEFAAVADRALLFTGGKCSD